VYRVARRQHQARDRIARRPQATHELESVAIRKTSIDDDGRVRSAAQRLPREVHAREQVGLDARGRECLAQERTQPFVVLDERDTIHASSAARSESIDVANAEAGSSAQALEADSNVATIGTSASRLR